MKNTIIILASMLLFATSCSQKQQQKGDELSGKLDQLDQLSGDYTPAQVGDYKSYHIAVRGKYENGAWIIDQSAAYIRPGRLPYGKASNGELEVKYTDASGKVLGQYLIENPGKLRTCDDGEHKSTIPATFDFEILLPGREDVKGFTISEGGKQLQEFKMPLRMVRDEMKPTTIPGANDTTRVVR